MARHCSQKRLSDPGLEVFLKTSSATGVHLYLPVEPRYAYEQLRTFAEIVARLVTADRPDLITQERIVAKRPAGRVLIDVQQNAPARAAAGGGLFGARVSQEQPSRRPFCPRSCAQSSGPKISP